MLNLLELVVQLGKSFPEQGINLVLKSVTFINPQNDLLHAIDYEGTPTDGTIWQERDGMDHNGDRLYNPEILRITFQDYQYQHTSA